MIYRNTNWTKRDYECTNIVACVTRPDAFHPDPKPTGDYWQPANETALTGLTKLHRTAGVEYWGYL